MTIVKLISALLLLLLVLGCSLPKKARAYNQRQTDKCLAKYHDAAKCRQLTYPSCEHTLTGDWCHQ